MKIGGEKKEIKGEKWLEEKRTEKEKRATKIKEGEEKEMSTGQRWQQSTAAGGGGDDDWLQQAMEGTSIEESAKRKMEEESG